MSADIVTDDHATPRRALSPDRLAELEEEKRFLLRSIADLERECAAGDVEEADYHALRDGYTARAAVVLRAIDAGRSGLPAKRQRNWKRLIGSTLAVLLVGVVAGVLVARASGQRAPGETITGGTSPDQVAALLSEGKSLLGVSDYGEATKRYLAVLKIDPNNVEALTYAGWVLAVSSERLGDQAGKAIQLEQSKTFIDQAIKTDPTYADPHCFEAVIDVLFRSDLTAAATNRGACYSLNPSSDMRGLVALNVDAALIPTTDTSGTANTGASTAGTGPPSATTG